MKKKIGKGNIYMPWCLYPFKHEMLSANQHPSPCCRFDKNQLSDSDVVVDNYGFYFQDIRNKILNNEIPAGCYNCVEQEKFNKNSMRIQSFNEFSNSHELEIEGMEIMVGRHCNLACFSCNSEYSTLWDEFEIYKSNWKTKELDIDNIPIEKFKYLEILKITGGEPFLHRQFFNLCDRLVKADLAKNIELEIFTNCTWFPSKVNFDQLLTFKKLCISLSLDGIKEVNDVLRSPSKWNTVEKVVEKWLYFRKNKKNVVCKIAHTISLQNVLYLPEIINYADTLGLRIMPQLVFDPDYMSIMAAPVVIKNKILSVLKEKNQNLDTDNGKRIYTLVYDALENKSRADKDIDYNFFYKIADIKKTNYHHLKEYMDLINEIIK